MDRRVLDGLEIKKAFWFWCMMVKSAIAILNNGDRSEFDTSRIIALIQDTQTRNPEISHIINGFLCQHVSW